MIISLIWGLIIIIGVNLTFQDATSIEDQVINNVKQTQILNAYNAEIIRCDNIYTDNSPNWLECIKNASLDFEITSQIYSPTMEWSVEQEDQA